MLPTIYQLKNDAKFIDNLLPGHTVESIHIIGYGEIISICINYTFYLFHTISHCDYLSTSIIMYDNLEALRGSKVKDVEARVVYTEHSINGDDSVSIYHIELLIYAVMGIATLLFQCETELQDNSTPGGYLFERVEPSMESFFILMNYKNIKRIF